MAGTLTERLSAPWTSLKMPSFAAIKAFDLIEAVNAATADERGETPFVIWSNEHRAWWGPNHCGYSTELRDAGCYSRDEAERICFDAGPGSKEIPNEIMMRLDDARRSTRWHHERDDLAPNYRRGER